MAYESPINALPPVVTALCLVIFAVELTMSAGAIGLVGGPGAIGWRLSVVQDYAVSPAVVDYVVWRGDLSFDLLKRFVTYAFVHGSFTDALFGGALLLALGKFVGDVFHPVATGLLFVISAIAGAVAFGLVADGSQPLYGAYPAVYGFIGAFTYLLWTRIGQQGGNQVKAFRLIGFLLALQLVFALIFGGTLRWVADVAGFTVGFAASIVLAPGGWAALLDRLRQR
ncbi:rhomboid family intramembrane serine protease [Loktanella sp. SALINAS62]|uniref:rhomboid family intramembrane serine protease n=1 Tax=Loktanella sp. SALINAS62 TaxID=2706124 RepID=UPI001B8BC909|nr:rhomboid family intramembrane serine protease [Loktanella sp. SALINAS62]MBS1301323.1 rhomboid family intramembrane serine protease [Loktanella sp. SALINAS62]